MDSNIFIKYVNFIKINFNLFKNLKYDSLTFFQYLLFFFTYFIGLNKVSNFGQEFVYVVSFTTLITDTQWDIVGAIKTITIIKITGNDFNYKKHIKKSYKFNLIVVSSIYVMFLILYPFYKPTLWLCLLLLGLDTINFLIYPIYTIKKYIIQLKYSALVATSYNIVNNTIRFLFSYLNTPFCTAMGQSFSGLSQLIGYYFLEKYYSNKKSIMIQEKNT